MMLQRCRNIRFSMSGACALTIGWVFATCTAVEAQEHLFTLDSDFDAGTLVGVNHDRVHDQLQLDESVTSHPFIWVVKSSRQTVVRIDAESGRILGEYRTAPVGRAGGPSRTAVDRFGNVWVGNQSESAGGHGSVVKIGLIVGGSRGHKTADGGFVPDPSGTYLAPPFLYSTAIDRDGDGLIRTSRTLGHVLGWTDRTDGEGGPTAEVEDAEDECILLYQRTTAPHVLHVAVDDNERVWVGGFSAASTGMDLLDAETGRLLGSMLASCGGYGGIVDPRGVVWSASFSQNLLMRYDPESGAASCLPIAASAGLAVDTDGSIWNTMWDRNTIAKLNPDGTMVPGFPKSTGGRDCFGVAVTPADNNVWVANKRTHNVSRLDQDGNLRKLIPVGARPTGVAVDALGKIWVVNQSSDNVVRIDPNADGDALGAVEQTVSLGLGARPVAYGNMAGVVESRQLTESGTWGVVHDGGRPAVRWSRLSWKSEEPGTSRIVVHVRSAEERADLAAAAWFAVENDEDLSPDVVGRWIEIRVRFAADLQAAVSPVLLELALSAESNVAPECVQAVASVEQIWPPNGRMVAVEILGVADPDGDPIECTIVGIQQDEPLQASRGGIAMPDARGVGTPVAYVRAARDGSGNGRVYTISYRADDGQGATCTGSVQVCVPHDMGRGGACIDDGELFDSTADVPVAESGLAADNYPNPFNPSTTIRFTTSNPGPVRLVVYNALGQQVRTLASGFRNAGTHAVFWDGRDDRGHDVASGVYVYRLRSGSSEVTNRMLLLK
jgi:streptogramin lyase